MAWYSNARSRKAITLLTAVLLLAVAGFFWNEARKEIFFLCANFAPGVAEASVRQQLDTGSFLQHRTDATPSGSRIVVDSWYNLKTTQCRIDLGVNGKVVQAAVE